MPALDIKICGIRDNAMLDAAIRAGATHVGLVFYPRSPRAVEADLAASLVRHAAGRVRMVGLFVDPAPGFVEETRARAGFDVIQLHGAETPEYTRTLAESTGLETWKAIGVRKRADLAHASLYRGAAARVLYDAKPPEGAMPGGTGLRIDWTMLRDAVHPLPWFLAGGLDPDNVGEAMAITGARAVDVSSGVESVPGIKDASRIAAFCRAVLG